MAFPVIRRISQLRLGFKPGVLMLDIDETIFRPPVVSLPPRLYDPHLPFWIALAKHAGWQVGACTARLQKDQAFTLQQLHTVGLYLDPVLFSDGGLKGPVLRQWCSTLPPSTPVLMVDDNPDQLTNCANALRSLPLKVSLYQFVPPDE
jgi:hypothetical protein